MAGLLKDIYSPAFYESFSACLVHTIQSFDKSLFLKQIFIPEFEDMELKERMKHTSKVLHRFLPEDYPESVELIKNLITCLLDSGFNKGRLEFIFFPDYIETYGLEDYGHSVQAIEFVTRFISCEFAVRPFILKYGDKMMKQMIAWSLHHDADVRRLASEGSRPRLPWAMALPGLKLNPRPILPILENLKNDPSEDVRRSVANSLNDITKDNPEIVINIARAWKGLSRETDTIIKHACRTLLKQGHQEILQYYGLDDSNLEISEFVLLKPGIRIGESLDFSFSIINNSDKKTMVRLEYAVYYRRLNGSHSRKVFKISEKVYKPNEKANIRRRQKFKVITTKTFYAGEHLLSIVVNGKEKQNAKFVLSAE